MKQKLERIVIQDKHKTLKTIVAGIATTAAISAFVIGIPLSIAYHETQTRKIYDLVGQAKMLEANNLFSARPWDYCESELTQELTEKINSPDAFYDACIDRIRSYPKNNGVREGAYLGKIYVPDVNGDGKVSSKH